MREFDQLILSLIPYSRSLKLNLIKKVKQYDASDKIPNFADGRFGVHQ